MDKRDIETEIYIYTNQKWGKEHKGASEIIT